MEGLLKRYIKDKLENFIIEVMKKNKQYLQNPKETQSDLSKNYRYTYQKDNFCLKQQQVINKPKEVIPPTQGTTINHIEKETTKF